MKYIIISLKHSTKDKRCFWRAFNSGYTYYPFNAGQYDEALVKLKPDYYNDGISTIAIPLTDAAMASIGFKVKIDFKALDNFSPNQP